MTQQRDPSQGSASSLTTQHWAEVARLLTLSQRSLQRLIAGMEPVEADWVLLWVCSQAPPQGMPQVAFAHALGISAAQVSVMVERLREQGWLESTRCVSDRRKRLWRVTESGLAILHQAGAELTRRIDCLESPIELTELDSLRQLLEKLAASLNSSQGRKGRAA